MIVFDLDGTLTPPKAPIPPRMAALLGRLLATQPAAVISGARWEQFRTQLLDHLPGPYDRLHLLPVSGGQYLRWSSGAWQEVYTLELAPADRRRIAAVLREGAAALGLVPVRPRGDLVDDRGVQVTYSGLGQDAARSDKQRWDPDGTRRRALAAWAAARLPDFQVRIAGTTSVDVTARGIDKAYGIRRLTELLDVPLGEILFVGDDLGPTGNDAPVRALGVRCVAVRGWEDTCDVVLRTALAGR